MHTLFTYGTLIIEEVMAQVTGRTFPCTDAVLHDYGRYRIRNEVYPGIVFRKGSRVEGKLYFNIDDEALARLDAFEDDVYERIMVRAVAGDGTAYDAFTYRIKGDRTDVLTEEPWDADEFRAEHIDEFIVDIRPPDPL